MPPMDLPRLDAEGLVIDAPRLEDARAWSEAQDEECARWFGWPCPPGLERCTEHLRHLTAGADPGEFTWAIRTPDRFAGGIDFKVLDGQWNVSYFVHPALRRRQVATRALQTVCSWAFANLDPAAITTRTHVDNLASQRVLEKVGFRCVATVPNEDADHLDRVFRLGRPGVR